MKSGEILRSLPEYGSDDMFWNLSLFEDNDDRWEIHSAFKNLVQICGTIFGESSLVYVCEPVADTIELILVKENFGLWIGNGKKFYAVLLT